MTIKIEKFESKYRWQLLANGVVCQQGLADSDFEAFKQAKFHINKYEESQE